MVIGWLLLYGEGSPRWREDSGIAMLQASSSSIGSAAAGAGQQAASRTHSQQQDQMQDQLSELHSYDSSRYAGSRQDGQPQHSTPVSAGDPITAGRRQQAEADSTGIDWSRSGGQQAGLQAMPMLNLRYQQPVSSTNSGSSGLLGRRSTAEQARGLSVDAAATHHSAIEMPPQGGTGSGGSSSWLTAAGPGWAPSDPAGLEPTANPYSPGALFIFLWMTTMMSSSQQPCVIVCRICLLYRAPRLATICVTVCRLCLGPTPPQSSSSLCMLPVPPVACAVVCRPC